MTPPSCQSCVHYDKNWSLCGLLDVEPNGACRCFAPRHVALEAPA